MSSVESRLSNQALADLARAGVLVTRHPFVEVAFEVHHVADRPGYFFELVDALPPPESPGPISGGETSTIAVPEAKPPIEVSADAEFSGPRDDELEGVTSAPDPFFETISSGAQGLGLVVRTAVQFPGGLGGNVTPPTRASYRRHVADPAAWIFRSTAQPNPSFLYESTAVLEGLISVERDPVTVLTCHGQAIRRVAQEVARAAVGAGAPILSLQAPVQLPPHTFIPAGSTDRTEDWSRSSSLGVRFAIAIGRQSSEQRSRLAASLAEFCSSHGFGFWLTDIRPAHRSGNWFSILNHNKAAAREYLGGLERRAVNWACPITLVGPARVGSTKAILDLLSLYEPSSTVAVSVTSLNDLAFIHLAVALPSGDRATYTAARREVEGWVRDSQERSLHEALVELISRLGLEGPTLPDRSTVAEVVDRADDYQVFAGPVLRLTSASENTERAGGRPLWISWEVERSAMGLSLPLRGLAVALMKLGLFRHSDARGASGGATLSTNIAYLICREVRGGNLRAKGKLNVPDALWKPLLPGRDRPTAGRLLAEKLEQLWQAELGLGPGSSRELTVAWRENWLGHWSATSA